MRKIAAILLGLCLTGCIFYPPAEINSRSLNFPISDLISSDVSIGASISTSASPTSLKIKVPPPIVEKTQTDSFWTMQISDFVQILIGLFALAVVYEQIRQLREVAQKDFDQRRRQATFDYISNTQNELRSRSKDIPLTSDPNLDTFICNEANRKAINKYLNYYERLSAGVNHGVFEIDIVDVLWGTTIINIYRKYKHFMETSPTDKDALWKELRILAIRLSEKRDKPNN